MKKGQWLNNLILAGVCFFVFDTAGAYEFYNKLKMDEYVVSFYGQQKDMLTEYQKETNFFNEFVSQSTTPNVEVYQKIAKALEGMKAQNDLYAVKLPDIALIKKQMDVIFSNKGEVRSDDKDNWKAFKKLNEDLDKGIKELKPISDSFYASDQLFFDLINQNGIRVGMVKDLQKKIQEGLGRLDAALADAHKKIPAAQETLKKFAGTKEADEKQKALDAMAVLMVQIEAKRQEIGVGVDLFNKRVVGMEKIYQGPGMKKITVFEDIKSKADEIKDLTGKFNDQANKLR